MTEYGKALSDASLNFAVRIAKLSRFLIAERQDFVLSRQILKSGTSIGANVREAQFAQSDSDFISKLSIALKEGSETQYWLEVLLQAEFIDRKQYASLRKDCDSLVARLVRAVKTSKSKLPRH